MGSKSSMETLVHGTSSTLTHTTVSSRTHTHTHTEYKRNKIPTVQLLTSISYDQWWKTFWGTLHTKRHPGPGLQPFQTGKNARVCEETLQVQRDMRHIQTGLNTWFIWFRLTTFLSQWWIKDFLCKGPQYPCGPLDGLLPDVFDLGWIITPASLLLC